MSALTAWLALAAAVEAGGQAPAASGAAAVARSASPTGMLLRRESEQKPWQVVAEGETLASGNLVLGLPGAVIESANGAIRVTFRPDFGGAAPLPIIETAVVLLENPSGADLAFNLDRGRVVVANQKKQGEARVVGQCQSRPGGEITFREPGAAVALELFSRWPPGVKFTKEPKQGDGPSVILLFLVLKGHVDLKLDTRHFAMSAPPGPAFISYDSHVGGDLTPQHLDKLPDWVTGGVKPEEAQKRKAIIEEFRGLVAKKSVDAAIEQMLASDDPARRRLAVFAMGAMDDLPRLGATLAATKHADVWDSGVIALRHWIGRAPGQDQKLYQALVNMRHYSPVDAESVVQLLHTFDETDTSRPELYGCLIDFLEHDKLALRGLAHWHLYRLVPEGRDINYSPLDSKDNRDKAVAAWRKLIPPGQLPPRMRKNKP